MTVRILGIELEPHRGVWPTVRDDDGNEASMARTTRLGVTKYAALLGNEERTWTVEGPWAATPELAAEALHATIRRLAEMEAKK